MPVTVTQPILYVNTPTYTGGAEISLLTLMRHLDPARYVPLLVTSGEGQLAETARGYGIETRIQDFPWFRKRYPWRYPASILRLADTMRKYQIALVHTNCDHSLRYVMQASRWTGVAYVSHIRDFTRSWFQPEKVKALNRAARVIANSRAIARACIEAGIEQQRVVMIYNPIDLEAFSVPAETGVGVREELNIPSSALVAGAVGQVQPEKGLGEFVEAAIRLASTYPDIHFLIVGAVPSVPAYEVFAESLRNWVRESGLEQRVRFLGFREDVPEVMQAFDILVVPSWTESFGRVAAEGQAAGCAVIGTGVGGLPEIITDGVDGLLIKPKDVDGLVKAISQLLDDAELRRRLGQEGRQTVKRFSVDRHVQAVQSLYDSVLSESSRP